jgi:hypothetical protein
VFKGWFARACEIHWAHADTNLNRAAPAPRMKNGTVQPVAVLILLLIVAAVIGLGWWTFLKAPEMPALVVPVLTALVCTTILAVAIRRSSAVRAAQLRGRSDAYEDVLKVILPGEPSEQSLLSGIGFTRDCCFAAVAM